MRLLGIGFAILGVAWVISEVAYSLGKFQDPRMTEWYWEEERRGE